MSVEQPELTFFKSRLSQVYFEFAYLLVAFFGSLALLYSVYFDRLGLDLAAKCYFYSWIGGFLGGLTYDSKWFFRVTSRGKDGTSPWVWEPNKLYWRLFSPFVASLVAFAVYVGVLSNVIPILTITPLDAKSAFAFSYITGYFSDIAISRLTDTADALFGKKAKDQRTGS